MKSTSWMHVRIALYISFGSVCLAALLSEPNGRESHAPSVFNLPAAPANGIEPWKPIKQNTMKYSKYSASTKDSQETESESRAANPLYSHRPLQIWKALRRT